MESQTASRDGLGVQRLASWKSVSFNRRMAEGEFQNSWNGEIGIVGSDRRFAFSRQASFRQSDASTPLSTSHEQLRPLLSRSVSSISIPPDAYAPDSDEITWKGNDESSAGKITFLSAMFSAARGIRTGSRPMKRLFFMISLNVAYSTAEFIIGIFSGRVGLVSDAFHLTFGCGLLTLSLFAMAASRKRPDSVYTYGYKRLEVIAAFTNAMFLLFMAFSLAVEALHAFIQDESEHKHYLIVSAVTNLLVNLIGVWFFRSYARINLVYRKAEDMNNHSVCLHVLADSIRSAGLILASWLLALGVKNAEVLCLGLVSSMVFVVVMPLFKATGGILLQMAPPSIPSSAFTKCLRQITSVEGVSEVSQSQFWELVPGHVIGSLSIQVTKGSDDHPILRHVHNLYSDLGIQDLTVQTDFV
ncbi:metal tolerance protein C2 [Aristolochia californica]|uniref:metal tolerance protein C2 n=1 Tax=Aristolochia californica TaxID=171875 RepID=UPI0035DDE557